MQGEINREGVSTLSHPHSMAAAGREELGLPYMGNSLISHFCNPYHLSQGSILFRVRGALLHFNFSATKAQSYYYTGYLFFTIATFTLHRFHQMNQPVYKCLLGRQQGAHHPDRLISLGELGGGESQISFFSCNYFAWRRLVAIIALKVGGNAHRHPRSTDALPAHLLACFSSHL